MTRVLFQNCRYLIARPDRQEVLQNASVLVSGADIIAVGPSGNGNTLVAGDLPVDIVDCSNKIVMPGLVNAHNHSPLSVTNLAMTEAADEGASAGELDLLQFIEDD